jgi:hypothetical protein
MTVITIFYRGDKVDNGVRLVTVIDLKKSQELAKNKILKDCNPMNQLAPDFLRCVKKRVYDDIGYNQNPIAAISKFNKKTATIRGIGEDVQKVLPVTANDSMILELVMPEDCLVSIGYNRALELSKEVLDATSEIGKTYALETVLEELEVGANNDSDDVLVFIPFIKLENCQYFTLLNSAFQSRSVSLPGVQRVELKALDSFE